METNLPDAQNEAESLRALNWPVSRREELRALLPSVPSGLTRLYQKSAVERLKDPAEIARIRSAGNGGLFTRSGTAPPATEIFHRTLEFRAAIDDKARTVQLSFSSEIRVARWFGSEILDHAAQSVRLGRLNGGAALLLDHDASRQIGVVVNARIDQDRKGRATVRFGKGQLADEIFQDVKDGIRRLVSVGYRIHKQVSEGTAGGVETFRVTDWEP